MVVNNFNISVFDELVKKYSTHRTCKSETEVRRVRLEVETMAEDAIERMCMFTGTRTQTSRRSACDRFREDRGERVATWLSTWALESDALDEWAVEVNRTAQVTKQLCSEVLGVCKATVKPWENKEEPNKPRLEDGERKAQSQATDENVFPLAAKFDGRVVPLTSSILSSVAIGFLSQDGVKPNVEGRDVLIYYYFERKDYDDWEKNKCRTVATWDGKLRGRLASLSRGLAEDEGVVHDLFYPAYKELARMLAGQRSLVLAKIDARCNDFVHPMSGFDVPTLALHTATNRGQTVLFTGAGSNFMNHVRSRSGVEIYELINFVMKEKVSPKTLETLQKLLKTHGKDSNLLRRPHGKEYFDERARMAAQKEAENPQAAAAPIDASSAPKKSKKRRKKKTAR